MLLYLCRSEGPDSLNLCGNDSTVCSSHGMLYMVSSKILEDSHKICYVPRTLDLQGILPRVLGIGTSLCKALHCLPPLFTPTGLLWTTQCQLESQENNLKVENIYLILGHSIAILCLHEYSCYIILVQMSPCEGIFKKIVGSSFSEKAVHGFWKVFF